MIPEMVSSIYASRRSNQKEVIILLYSTQVSSTQYSISTLSIVGSMSRFSSQEINEYFGVAFENQTPCVHRHCSFSSLIRYQVSLAENVTLNSERCFQRSIRCSPCDLFTFSSKVSNSSSMALSSEFLCLRLFSVVAEFFLPTLPSWYPNYGCYLILHHILFMKFKEIIPKQYVNIWHHCLLHGCNFLFVLEERTILIE